MPIAPVYGRTRRRTVPQLGNSNTKVGKVFPPILVNGQPTGRYSSIPELSAVVNLAANCPWSRAQVTMDTIHKRTSKGYRTGDDFSCLSYDWCTPFGVIGSGTFDRADMLGRYVGGFHPPIGGGDFSPPFWVDKFAFANQSIGQMLSSVNNTNHPNMDGLGDKGWKLTKPKLQKADLAVFGAEMRDMPRMLKQTSKRFHDIWRMMGGHFTNSKAVVTTVANRMRPKKVADDFLNQQFGWKPFLGDLLKFNTVVTDYHDIIAKLQHRNDRWVRRRVPLGGGAVTTHIHNQLGNKCLPMVLHASYFSSPPSYTVTQVENTLLSAVGKFRYYRPEFDSGPDEISQWNQAMQFITVSGLRPTPSNVYKAIPWTWLIDWFSNVGDYVDHLNDIWIDSVVAEYVFVMKHQITTREFHQDLPFRSMPLALKFIRKIDSKQRLRGHSPYAFDLSWDSLDPRKLAILAALGITR